MKIDLYEFLEKRTFLGMEKGVLLKEFYRITKTSENDKVFYTDDKDYFSFIINWNEFFFEKNKLESINIDLSNTIFLKNEGYKFNEKLDLNNFISYLNLFDIDWQFYNSYCIMKQLCLLVGEIIFLFVEKDGKMIINKIKLFPDLT